MQEVLIRKLHRYIKENNPDVLLALQEENKLRGYLQESIQTVDALLNQLLAEEMPLVMVEEHCMDELTRPLRPSKFLYIKEILEEVFPNDYQRLLQSGILIPESVNMISFCDPVFEALQFNTENEEDHYLRYAVIGTLDEYMQKV